jgi:glycosyltransferase involved in cell wall biosynthesis
MRSIIRDQQSEVVHIHNLTPALSPSVVRAASEVGAAVVMTLHNYRLLCLPSTLLRDGRICEDCVGRPVPWPGVIHRCYRGSLLGSAVVATSMGLHHAARTYDRVDLFLAVSPFVRETIVRAGMPASRVRTKSNFSWPTERRVGPGEHFLFAGRLSPEKGLETLLAAWDPSLGTLLVVGDGPDGARLRRAAPAGVEFVGQVPGSEMPSLLRSSRALLLPSIWYEAQPRTILEAYAAGVPVVVSRIGGLPDLVTEGSTGLVVAPGDPPAWAAAVRSLLVDEEVHRLGDGAFRMWEERYGPEPGIRDLEGAYEEAMAARALRSQRDDANR